MRARKSQLVKTAVVALVVVVAFDRYKAAAPHVASKAVGARMGA